jgi:hypothetical protein
MQIMAPIELEFIFEKDYFQYLTEHAPEYMAALALLQHSHSDVDVTDPHHIQSHPVVPDTAIIAPPEPQQQALHEKPSTGKAGTKGRSSGGDTLTSGRLKRRRTGVSSSDPQSSMSFDVHPHDGVPIHSYTCYEGVPDPTVRYSCPLHACEETTLQ